MVALLCFSSTEARENKQVLAPRDPTPHEVMKLTPRVSPEIIDFHSMSEGSFLFPPGNMIPMSSRNRLRRSYPGSPGPPGPSGTPGSSRSRGRSGTPGLPRSISSYPGNKGIRLRQRVVGDSNMCRACARMCYKRDNNCDCRADFGCFRRWRQSRSRSRRQRLWQRLRL
ncbi:hypothetical protein FHG87_012680 [Trinorchestia longiramus]|nr:hypothetical protein FHG87_012680 [Trinorchestia longiramus]